MEIPTLLDVYKAKKVIQQYVPRIDVQYASGLSELMGCDIYLKREDQLPLGAFKMLSLIHI